MEVKGLLKNASQAPPGKGATIGKSSTSIGAAAQDFSFKVGFQTPTSPFKRNRRSVRADFQKMNDLATLLAPQPNQMLSNDISAATLNSQRMLK